MRNKNIDCMNNYHTFSLHFIFAYTASHRRVFHACNTEDRSYINKDQIYHFVGSNSTRCSCLLPSTHPDILYNTMISPALRYFLQFDWKILLLTAKFRLFMNIQT